MVDTPPFTSIRPLVCKVVLDGVLADSVQVLDGDSSQGRSVHLGDRVDGDPYQLEAVLFQEVELGLGADVVEDDVLD